MDTKLNTLSRQLTQMTQTPRGQELLGHINIFMEPGKRVANQNDGYVFFSPSVIVMFTIAILQQAM